MKIFNKFAMTLLLAAALATGCADDDIRQNGGQDQPSENIGYLSLSGLNVSVLSDTEVITGSGKSVETRAEVNVGDFTVEIIDSEGVKLHHLHRQLARAGMDLYKLFVKFILRIHKNLLFSYVFSSDTERGDTRPMEG